MKTIKLILLVCSLFLLSCIEEERPLSNYEDAQYKPIIHDKVTDNGHHKLYIEIYNPSYEKKVLYWIWVSEYDYNKFEIGDTIR